MRLAILSPNLPPARCGVGDYTARLAAELLDQGHEVEIFTGTPDPSPVAHDRISARVFPKPWDFQTMRKIGNAVVDSGFKHLSVQYTSYLFGPKSFGIRPDLPVWIAGMERAGVRTSVTAHEVAYPVGLNARGMLIGLPQFLQFQGIVAAASDVFFTNELARDRYRSIYRWKTDRLVWLPVGSNIEPSEVESSAGGAEIPDSAQVLLHFGRGHMTRLMDWSFEALREARARLGDDGIRLVFVGYDKAELRRALKERKAVDLEPLIGNRGTISPAEVSAWMNRADLVIAPFMDGVSARRGSVICALAHGRPVITTRAWWTDPGIPWDTFALLVDAGDKKKFVSETCRLLGDEEERKRMGEASRKAYEKYFSWPSIASRFAEAIGG